MSEFPHPGQQERNPRDMLFERVVGLAAEAAQAEAAFPEGVIRGILEIAANEGMISKAQVEPQLENCRSTYRAIMKINVH